MKILGEIFTQNSTIYIYFFKKGSDHMHCIMHPLTGLQPLSTSGQFNLIIKKSEKTNKFSFVVSIHTVSHGVTFRVAVCENHSLFSVHALQNCILSHAPYFSVHLYPHRPHLDVFGSHPHVCDFFYLLEYIFTVKIGKNWLFLKPIKKKKYIN